MVKFTKGRSYIVTGAHKQRYIVHQTGLKSWRASLFTHIVKDDRGWKYAVIEGNATTLFDRLKSINDSDPTTNFEVRAYNTDTYLRKDMFDVLMYGCFKD